MFGTNRQSKQDLGDGFLLEVKEIFPTIQGEGPLTGMPAIFIRLAGCHLKCYFCDTNFESGERLDIHKQILPRIEDVANRGKCNKTTLIVLTGGEPMRQNILPLCIELAHAGYHIQIETSGNFWVPGLEKLVDKGYITIVCSPKTGHVHEEVARNCEHWKYIIQDKPGYLSPIDGLPVTSTQVEGMRLSLFRPFPLDGSDVIWLQPCEAYGVITVDTHKIGYNIGYKPDQIVTKAVRDKEQTRRNAQLATEIAMKYNYRLSIQTHKILGLP